MDDDWTLVERNKFKHICYQTSDSSSVIPPTQSSTSNRFVIAKGDSAALQHYFTANDKSVLIKIRFDKQGPTVLLPNSESMTSHEVGELPLSQLLSTASKKASIFDNLHSSLVSLGQLCDNHCIVILGKDLLEVIKDGIVVLRGPCSQSGDGLWDIPLPQQPDPTPTLLNITPTSTRITPQPKLPKIPTRSLNVIIRKDKTKHDLVHYLHATAFSPTTPTFLEAIKNNFFTTWPGLTPELVSKHLTPTVQTAKGHLNQEKAGLRSTKPMKQSLTSIEKADLYPPSDTPNIRTNDVVYAMVSTSDKGFLDLPGRFPHCSSRGNQYIVIAYVYDANAILGVPIKNRQAGTITAAWQTIHHQLQAAGAAPNLWVLDNEASTELKQAMTKKDTKFQLVPPYTHRANAAERAIQTFKNHFKAGLASLDPDFPITEWDRLLDHCFLTLNMLRGARTNPKLSAHAFLFGQFDFNATPLAPPGTKVVIHSKPEKRASWDPNGREGWYIGPSPHHYRCMKCFVPRTRTEINADTLIFIPKKINFPEVTAEDFLKQAASDIITILTTPQSSPIPSLEAGNKTKNALLQLAQILNRAFVPSASPPTTKPDPPAMNYSPTPIPSPPPTPQPTLKETLQRLARVLKKPKQPAPTPSNKFHNYKHQAAHFLVQNKLYKHPLQKVFHIYDQTNQRLTMDKVIQNNYCLKISTFMMTQENVSL